MGSFSIMVMGLTAAFYSSICSKIERAGSAFVDTSQADLSHKVSFDLKDVFSLNLHAHGRVILEHSKGFPWTEYVDNLAISIPLL